MLVVIINIISYTIIQHADNDERDSDYHDQNHTINKSKHTYTWT